MRDWIEVQRRLIARAIGELSYEQVLDPASLGRDHWELRLSAELSYRFQAWKTVWDFLRVDENSIYRINGNVITRDVDAEDFYLDIRGRLEMSDIVFANFLDELQRTIQGDLLLTASRRRFGSFLSLPDSDLQSLLDGHPKALLNKGRVGWSESDLQAYSPESLEEITLCWIAMKKERVEVGLRRGLTWEDMLNESLALETWVALEAAATREGISARDYHYLPVHPWQWDEVISIHYAADRARGDLVYLGQFGGGYRPQTSLRTLSNAVDPTQPMIKVALSILNTSCIRGIAGQFIPIAPALSQALQDLCAADPVLKDTHCLRDIAGALVKQRAYHAIPGSPYRFRETLGVVLRESPEKNLKAGERSLLVAALHQKDRDGFLIASALIRESGIDPSAWLREYTQAVIIPLYHLQVKYGVGLVAHGQNIVLKLRNNRAAGVFLKDFHGDLRFVDQDYPEMRGLLRFADTIQRLPPHYLIHDMLTGHFVTVLRFLSAGLAEDGVMTEARFYRIVAREIEAYHQAYPQYSDRWQKLGLLAPKIPRLVVNKVRFEIGYGDTNARPIPTVGTDLINPLLVALEAKEAADGSDF